MHIFKKSAEILFMILFATAVHAQNFDINLLKQINPKYPTSNTWKTISSTAEPLSAAIPFSMLMVSLINNNPKMEHKSYEVAASLLTAVVLTEGLKVMVKRPRPYITYPGEIFPDQVDNESSFPSGHTSFAFATATSVFLNYPKWYVGIPLLAWSTSVGYSRMYLGQHYPSDVIAGALVGAGSAYLCHWLNKKYFTKRKK